MGSSPYWYFVPYEEDKNLALKKLKEREFNAGRYYPAVMFPEFPITQKSESPGKEHKSIQKAIEDADATGTRSILDMNSVSENDDYCTARIPKREELLAFFGTESPTREMLENNQDYFEGIDRGKGFCITVFENTKPKELFFVGYSFD